MDIFTTLTTIATAYTYYKASVYVYDTADRTYRFINLCRNAVGYVRRPIRYYQEQYQIVDKPDDDISDESVNGIFPRSLSCNDMRYNTKSEHIKRLPLSKSLIQFPKVESQNSLELTKEPNSEIKIPTEVGPSIEIKKKPSLTRIKNRNRTKSNSMCSNTTNKTQLYEDDMGINWVLVKNPDY